MSRDYVRTLRSRGLSMNRVVYKHVLRNAGGPALAVLAVQFIGLLGGAVIVEQVFALPGIGQLTVAATSLRATSRRHGPRDRRPRSSSSSSTSSSTSPRAALNPKVRLS